MQSLVWQAKRGRAERQGMGRSHSRGQRSTGENLFSTACVGMASAPLMR